MRTPLGKASSNVQERGSKAGRRVTPRENPVGSQAATPVHALRLQEFAARWVITADEARMQQLVDGVPGPFGNVVLAYNRVSARTRWTPTTKPTGQEAYRMSQPR